MKTDILEVRGQKIPIIFTARMEKVLLSRSKGCFLIDISFSDLMNTTPYNAFKSWYFFDFMGVFHLKKLGLDDIELRRDLLHEVLRYYFNIHTFDSVSKIQVLRDVENKIENRIADIVSDFKNHWEDN